MAELPSYDELPLAPEGGRSGWGVFGDDDNVGLFNLLTPERVLEAARLIRKGALFPLDAPVDAFSPPVASSQGYPRHHMMHVPGTIGFDDVLRQLLPPGFEPVGLAGPRWLRPGRVLQRRHRGGCRHRPAQHHRALGPARHCRAGGAARHGRDPGRRGPALRSGYQHRVQRR